ncbi:hypothetical protein T05_10634 [Trichinella murrelli]|uniref:Uncharacterized protein n=1 Tax=Trichinella murrelli TaxID=144512 RepID=A0A0V0T0X7_9BILA|nr:hypothetical protein T05_10634 [Trichinella murrelli]
MAANQNESAISVIWPLVKQRFEFYSPRSSMTQK